MQIKLNNNKTVLISLAGTSDAVALHHYFLNLSPLTQSRYTPHAFDAVSVMAICHNNGTGYTAFVATDIATHAIVAYMLLRQGMLPADFNRYANRNQFYNYTQTVSFAPSVADAWQSSGLGTAMNQFLEMQLKKHHQKNIVLWGGVQAGNEKAVSFYKKQGYQLMGSFYQNGMQNFDMIKTL